VKEIYGLRSIWTFSFLLGVCFKKRLALQAAFFIFAGVAQLVAQGASEQELAAESRRAKELMAAHQFAEAIPIYEKLVKAVPGNAGLLLNLAMAEELGGRPAASIPHFEAVLKAQPDNLPALLSLSMARLELNQPREAIPSLRKAIQLDPDNVNAIGMLANAEMSQQLFDEAAQHYRELTMKDENDPRAWYGLAKAYESLSMKTFDRLNKAAPESPYVAALLADTRLERRQFRSAFFFYRDAGQKMPDLPGIHAGLAEVYRETGHADWASSELQHEKALTAPDCHAKTAKCAFLNGKPMDAAKAAMQGAGPEDLFWATKAYNQLAGQAFDRLTQLPESVQIHAFKAQMYRDHRQLKEAADEWRAALKLSPDDREVKRQLAAALFDAKDYQATMPIAQEELTREPGAPDLNYLVGASLFRTEQPEKALPYLETAVKGNPEILPAYAALGLTLVALNRNADAIPYLRKALPLDDDGSIHYSLSRAYRAAGDTPHATEAMQEYQKIQKQNQQIDAELSKEAEISAPQ
jgi:tetratricopeptide (TPR) repeat protein